LRGPLYPEFLNHFGLRDSQGSYFFLLSNLVSIGISLSVGFWLKKLGVYRAMLLWLASLFVSCILLGTTSSLTGIYASVLGFGLTFGGIGVVNSELVVRGSHPHERTRAFSAFHLGYAIISILAPLMVSMSLKLGWQWNRVYLFVAIIPMLMLALLPFSLKNSKQELATEIKSEVSQNNSNRSKLTIAFLLWASITPAAYQIAEQLISSRMVLLLRSSRSYTPDQANGLLSGFAAMFFVGRAYLTLMGTKWSNEKLCITSSAATVIAYFLALSIHPLFFILVGLTMSVFFPAFSAYALESREEHVARISGWTAVSCSIAMLSFNGGFGQISDYIGIEKAFAIVGLSLSSLVLLGLFANRLRNVSRFLRLP
jgi:fucose permease